MFTRFNLKNSKGNSNVLIDQYSILLAIVYLKLGKNRKRSEFEEKFADTNEDFLHTKHHLSHYRDFLPSIKNNAKGIPAKYNEIKYQRLFQYIENQKVDKSIMKYIKENRGKYFEDFFSIVDSYQNERFVKWCYALGLIGIIGAAVSIFLIIKKFTPGENSFFWGNIALVSSLSFILYGFLFNRIYHGKVKSTWLKSRFLINVECCFQRLDELEMALTQKLNLNCNDKFKGNYDNPDDFSIPFAARVHKENPNLYSNIINTFIELNYIQMATDSNKLVAIEKEIVVTYFRENCPKIKAKEYVEYFNNFTKKSQISGNNLKLKKSDKEEYATRKTKKYEAEIEKCLKKHKLTPDDKNPEKSGQH